ncbi:MAG: cytochrome c family protein [Verrucomicrobiia bacterium]
MMNCAKALSSNQMPWLILMAGILFIASPLMAQSVQHLGTTQAGGMPGLPVMGGVEQLTNGVQVTWDGPSGYYQVYQKSNSLSAPWVALGKTTNLVRYAVITRLYSNAFFRVSGPAPNYAGSKVCLTCHLSICQYETNTPHASAFSSPAFKAAGGQTNSSCLPCHTVGYGLPTGFSFTNKNGIFSYTTNLAGVQCENCHGPAANHAASEDDPTAVPQVDIAATVCGGCHTGPMQPTYEEWNTSGHAAVVPDALQVMSSSTTNISSCGQCHSGSVRLALINGQNPITLTNDLNVAITCVVCHDPHQTNGNPAQLRNPLSSTNYFSLATTAVFTNVYPANTNINLCAQCHNDRGATWTNTVSAPHYSLQYNFLLGSVGQLWNGVTDSPAFFNPGTHAGLPESAQNSISGTFYLTNQCVSCHMQPDAPPANIHSHTFAVTSDAVCLNCHLDDPGQSGPGVSNEVTTVIVLLNSWAATKGAALQANGVVAWEYTTPGGLILQTNSLGYATGWTRLDHVNYSGPSAADQALIPDNIKKARFDLYLVVNDGSLGAHNWIFALNLLSAAENLIGQEIDQ